MPTLLLRFPGGRYHATPWGHHVNEGQIEWPPSPWRLLRALIASGFSTQHWIEVPPVGRRLIETLAGTLPTYYLPRASAAHSRHYMPLGALDKGREKTALVFDTWANVGSGTLAIRWECDLDDDERTLFACLAEHLGYLGRSESWVEAETVSDDETTRSEDDQIMIRIQSGDPHAFEELVKLHQGPLIGFFFRNTRDAQLSEDLTQETLLRVYNQSWDYIPLGRFKGWMFRIARNLFDRVKNIFQ